MTLSRRSIALAACTLAAAACSNDGPAGPARPARLAIAALPDSIGAGDTILLAAAALDAAGRPLAAPNVTWHSLASAIASVDATGRLVARDTGTVGIVASAGRMADTALVRVAMLPRRLEFVVAPDSVTFGSEIVVRAVAYDGIGRRLGAVPVSYALDDTTAATPFTARAADTTATARPIRSGTFTLVARAGALRAERSVRLALHAVPMRGLALRHVGLGSLHGCGLDASGTAQCWGSGYGGQLGRGSTGVIAPLPVGPVVGPPAFDTLAVGTGSTCGITTARRLWCWGVLGASGTGTPTALLPDSVVSRVSAGDGYGCALTVAGQAWCWGFINGSYLETPTPLPVDERYVEVATWVRGQGCGILASGRVTCWHYPTPNGVLSLRPVGGTHPPFTRVAIGDQFGCGLTAAGEIWCWGSNGVGQTGTGAPLSTFSWVAQRVASSATFASLDAGQWSACGGTADGRVLCWGRDPEHRITRPVPVSITADAPFRGTIVGRTAECGILAPSGDLRCTAAPPLP